MTFTLLPVVEADGELLHEPYRESLHQPAFSELLSIDATRSRCPSFEYLVRAVGELIGEPNDRIGL